MKFYENKFSTVLSSKQKWAEIKNMNILPNKQKSLDVVDYNLDQINHSFVNLDTPNFPPILQLSTPAATNNNDDRFYFHGISENEVLEAIKSVKSTAVGLDNIHPRFLKMLLPIIIPFITYIFNNIICRSIFPLNWKRAKVIPIPKPSGDLRPISILPFLSKVLEKIMHNQITRYLEQNEMLSNHQSGFRNNHSCVTALIDVVEDIRAKIDCDSICILTLLDHTKAFNCVEPEISCFKLYNNFNFSASATQLIRSYLSQRKQNVCVNNSMSSPLNVTKGVPQGSILGPLLFNLYINDLPEVLHSANIHIYADDIQLYMFCDKNSISQCINNLNDELERVNEWALKNHLCINPSKSKCLLIGKKALPIPELDPPRIGDQPIHYCETAKNLGITFNRTLSWNNHISAVVGKVYGMLRILWGSQNYTPIHIRLLLSKTYLVPTLLYGCEIFANSDQASRNKLNVVFNNIARYVFNRRRDQEISEYSKQIFGINFNNILKLRTLITLHKIINTKKPEYLFNRIRFTQSQRSKKIILPRHNALLSERQFFIHSIRLWNSLPNSLTFEKNTYLFKKSVINHFQSQR